LSNFLFALILKYNKSILITKEEFEEIVAGNRETEPEIIKKKLENI
jgi:hypothetical protein